MVAALGTVSCSNSRRFGTYSTLKLLTPVRLPPGRFRLETMSNLDRIEFRPVKTIGIVTGRPPLRARTPGMQHPVKITVTCRRTKSAAMRREAIKLIFRPAVFDCYVAALGITGLGKSLPIRVDQMSVKVGRCGAEEPDYRHYLLRSGD